MASLLLTSTTTTELYHGISIHVNRYVYIFCIYLYIGAGAGSSESRSNQRPNDMSNKLGLTRLLCASKFSINQLFASMQAIIDPDKQLSTPSFCPPMCGLLFGVNGWNLLNDHLRPGPIRV